MRWILCKVAIAEHDEFLAWCKARGTLPEWDHSKVGEPFYAWVWLNEPDRVFAKLRWG